MNLVRLLIVEVPTLALLAPPSAPGPSPNDPADQRASAPRISTDLRGREPVFAVDHGQHAPCGGLSASIPRRDVPGNSADPPGCAGLDPPLRPLGPAAPARRQGFRSPFDFRNDTSYWVQNGECDHVRSESDGMRSLVICQNRGSDAAQRRPPYSEGRCQPPPRGPRLRRCRLWRRPVSLVGAQGSGRRVRSLSYGASRSAAGPQSALLDSWNSHTFATLKLADSVPRRGPRLTTDRSRGRRNSAGKPDAPDAVNANPRRARAHAQRLLRQQGGRENAPILISQPVRAAISLGYSNGLDIYTRAISNRRHLWVPRKTANGPLPADK